MSYDLAAFDPAAAPRTPDDFVAWYSRLMDDEEPSSPAAQTPLARWTTLMQERFPDKDDGDDDEDDRWGDYSSSFPTLVYAAFAWSSADEARERALNAAARAGTGLFLLSDDQSVHLPDGAGGLRLAFTVAG